MGLVQKQSLQNAIFTYLGVAIGYFNKVVLFQTILSAEQYGLVELLIAFMVLGSELAQFGISKIIIRFTPFFQEDKKGEGQFLFFALFYGMMGFLLFLVLFYFFHDYFVGIYSKNSELFASKVWYLVPLVAAHMLYRITSSISRAKLISVTPIFSWEVALRVCHLGAILLYQFGLLSFEGFLNIFVLSYFLPSILITSSLLYKRKFNLSLGLDKITRKRTSRIIVNYGMFASLSDTTTILVNKMDMVMIGWLLGEAMAGAYAMAFYISTIVFIPYRAMQGITISLLSINIKQRKWKEVESLCQKASINSLLIGGLIFVGIIVNLDPFFELFPKFAEAKTAVYFLGIGILINSVTGIQRSIIINSKLFRFDLLSNVFLLVLVVGTNLWLIPVLGLTGAAIATALSLFLVNLLGVVYVRIKFNILPFSKKTLPAILIITLFTLLGSQIPDFGHPVMEIILNSIIIGVPYSILVYVLRLSPDINQLVDSQINRLKGFLHK